MGALAVRPKTNSTQEVSFPMQITWELIIVSLIGALAGTLARMVVKRSKVRFGRATRIGIGLVGALLLLLLVLVLWLVSRT